MSSLRFFEKQKITEKFFITGYAFYKQKSRESFDSRDFCLIDYFIPKNIRELQLDEHKAAHKGYYFIPKNIRELQLELTAGGNGHDYFIPKNIRELQRSASIGTVLLIISYQKISGNYNFK